MADSALSELDVTRLGKRNAHRRVLVAVAVVIFAVAAMVSSDPTARLVLGLVAGVLGTVLILGVFQQTVHYLGADTVRDAVTDLIEHDHVPSFLARADGTVLFANARARDTFGRDSKTLAGALKSTLANPGAILFRLEHRARGMGSASEDVVTRQGHLRISVNRAGEGRFLWRFEKSADRTPKDGDPTGLAMLTVGRNDAILFMNPAARALVGERVRSLDRLFLSLPVVPGQVQEITTQDGSVPCMVVEVEGTAGRRELYLLPGVKAPDRMPDGWAFFDDLPVPLLRLSADGQVELSNRPARTLLGIETAYETLFSNLVEGLGRSVTDWLRDAAHGTGVVQPEVMRVRRDDCEVFVQVALNKTQDRGKTVLVAVISDATDLKSLERQFVQSQKMQAIGQLAGGVAHDFNNLLTAISGHCDLLMLRHNEGDADFADLMQIHQNTNRAAALVSQLLAYSRKQTLRLEVLDLRDTLADLIHLLDRLVGEKVSVQFRHDAGLDPVRVDKRQFEQVIMNLVVNARDAMPEGGEIQIETENLVLDQPMERNRAVVQPGKYVVVRVKDQGCGMSSDKLEKIFEPFYTTKRVGEGTGLGLSTAYGIVKQTGGFIFSDSTLGEGSCFQLIFPAQEAHQPTQTVIASEQAPPHKAEGTVLLVEDEAPVRAFASRALQMHGFVVIEAESAEHALDLLDDAALSVDVFVTDVIMPGLDGPSWVREALKERPDTKVVFMSGYSEDAFADHKTPIQGSVFLSKPFSLSELSTTVTNLINRRPERDQETDIA